MKTTDKILAQEIAVGSRLAEKKDRRVKLLSTFRDPKCLKPFWLLRILSRSLRRTIAASLLALEVTTRASVAQGAPTTEKSLPSGEGSQGRNTVDLIVGAQIEQIYGPPLASLGLSFEKLNRVKELLAERTAAARSAQKTMPKHLSIGEQKEFIERAGAEVDQKIKTVVESPIYEKIQEMIFVEHELSNIVLNYVPAMMLAGVPLDGPQSVALAKVFKSTYSDVDSALTKTTDFAAIRSAKTQEEKTRAEAPLRAYRAYRTRDVNSLTGLSAADREVMSQAARFLTSGQLSVLQKKLAEITQGYLRRATETSSLPAKP